MLPRQRRLKPLILPTLVELRARGQLSPIDTEAMLLLREGWAVPLEDGIEHAQSGGWGLSVEDYQAVCASLASSQTPAGVLPALDVPAELDVDWAHLRPYILARARQPYNVGQLIQVQTLTQNWQSVLDKIEGSIEAAYDAIEAVIQTTTLQRGASLAVSGRMAWGFLSTMVPPPVGVALGAIVLWSVDDKHSDGIMKMLEWWLQMPFLFDRNTGQVVPPTYHNRYNNPSVQNRFPPAFNPGGQESMKDTKDFNQMLKGLEQLYSGDRRKAIDDWDKHTIKNVMARLDELGRGKSRSLQASFRTAADELANQLKRALREVLGEYEKPAGSRRLINALFAL